MRSAKVSRPRLGGWVLLGAVFNLAVAAGMYYATWWKADPHIYMVFMTKLPLDVPRDFAHNPLGLNAATLEALGQLPEEGDSSPDPASPRPRWDGKSAQLIIPITAYGWLTFATASACGVGLAGGAWLGRAAGRPVRLWGLICAAALTLYLGYAGYGVWSESQKMFDPDKLRLGMGMLVLVIALFGIPLAARARGITRLAVVTILAAALATGAAVWLGAQSGALDLKFAHWTSVAAAFTIHGFWGILMLLALKRMEI